MSSQGVSRRPDHIAASGWRQDLDGQQQPVAGDRTSMASHRGEHRQSYFDFDRDKEQREDMKLNFRLGFCWDLALSPPNATECQG